MATSSFWRGLAPVWLRILAGLLLFPILWLVFQLLAFGLFPAVRGLTENLIVLLSIIAAGIAAAFLIRKSSLRRASVLSFLALLVFAMGSLALIGSRSPTIESRYGGSAEPSEEPPDMAAAEPPTAPPDMAGAESPLKPVQPQDGAGAGQSGGGYHYEIPPALGLSEPPAAEAPGPDVTAPSGGGSGLALQPPPPEPSLQAEHPSLGPPSSHLMPPGASDHQILFGDPTLPPPQLALPDNEMIVAGQPPERSGQLPEFPWPPPSASASYVLPDKLFVSYRTVGEVAGAILGALEQNGYVERSFFRTPPGGVALVTRLERINDDGSPSAEGVRWPAGEPHTSTRSLLELLQGLFFVDPGHYRVIVFVVQDMPFSQSSEAITAQQAQTWLTFGANVLSPQIAALPFAGGHVTVLIYEFASDGSKVQVVTSQMTGKQHLERAGVLTALDQVQ